MAENCSSVPLISPSSAVTSAISLADVSVQDAEERRTTAVSSVAETLSPPKQLGGVRVSTSKHFRALMGKNQILKRRQWSTAACCSWCPIAACCELFLPLAILALLWWAKDQCLQGGQCSIPVLEGWGGHMPKDELRTTCVEGLPLESDDSSELGYSSCHPWTDYLHRPLPFHELLSYLQWSGKRLALAVQDADDIPKIEHMRDYISKNWYPDVYMLQLPCVNLEIEVFDLKKAEKEGLKNRKSVKPLPCEKGSLRWWRPGVLRSFKNLTDPKIYVAAELESHLTSADYGKDGLLYGAVVFSSVGGNGELGAAGNWAYEIRLNVTAATTPLTQIPKTRPLDLGLKMKEATAYLERGFVALQLLLDRYIIGKRDESVSTTELLAANGVKVTPFDLNSTRSQLAEPLHYLPQSVETVPMPVGGVIIDGFYALIAPVFPLVFIIAFLYTQKSIISELITEKETKVRESLRMMGVSSGAIIGSWYGTHALIFAVMCSIFAAVAKLHIFPSSSATLIFVFFWLWSMSFLAFALFVHSFFNHARAGGIVGVVLMFLQWVVYESQNQNNQPASTRVMQLLMVMPNAAFCAGLDMLSKFEGVDIGAGWTNLYLPVRNSNMGTVLTMMLFDVVVWTFLGWYLDRVLPKEFGVRMPPHFLFLPSYWKGTTLNVSDSHISDGLDEDVPAQCENQRNVEDVPQAVRTQSADSGVSVKLSGLRREFSTPGGTKVAVADLHLTMYEGQVLALLGHNGAGKSTTINMLTGMVAPSDGDARIVGYSLRRDIAAIRRVIGVCPQHDVLWMELTVFEHLDTFARLRGVAPEDIPNRADDMMREVGLSEKKMTRAGSLSGGQKRKLSLCLALIGQPPALFLDEPTSGMDPFSRRSTWNIIRSNREGRVTVLTTHFMDEADILGDRVAVMTEGKLQCCGSPLFLKNRFGAGYRITCAMKKVGEVERPKQLVKEIITRHVLGAEELTDVGAELSLRLPTAAVADFANLFDELDEKSKELHVEHYGLSMVTMEEVFLTIANGDIGGLCSPDCTNVDEPQPLCDAISSATVQPQDDRPEVGDLVEVLDTDNTRSHCPDLIGKRANIIIDTNDQQAYQIEGTDCWFYESDVSLAKKAAGRHDRESPIGQQAVSSEPLVVGGASEGEHEARVVKQKIQCAYPRHLGALFLKRVQYGRRDCRALACMVLLPVAFLVVGLWMLARTFNTEMPPLVLDTLTQYGDTHVFPYNSTAAAPEDALELNTAFTQANLKPEYLNFEISDIIVEFRRLMSEGSAVNISDALAKANLLPENIPEELENGSFFGVNYSKGVPVISKCEFFKCLRQNFLCSWIWSEIETMRDLGIKVECHTDYEGCNAEVNRICRDDANVCTDICVSKGSITRSLCKQQCMEICHQNQNISICDFLKIPWTNESITIGWVCPVGCADPTNDHTCSVGTTCQSPSTHHAASPSDTLRFQMDLFAQGQGLRQNDVRYGAVKTVERNTVGTTVTLLYNTSGPHIVPTLLNLVSTSLKQALHPGSSIAVTNHPMPLTEGSDAGKVVDAVVNLFSTCVVMEAFAFIPAAIVAYIVREREVQHNSKHQQLISGVGLFSYWSANFLWDLCVYMVPLGLSLLFIQGYGIQAFVENGAFWASFVILIGYGVAVAPFTYLMSFLFSHHTTAQVVCLVVSFLVGPILVIVSYILSIIENTKSVNQTLMWIFRIFPGFSLGHGLLQVCTYSVIVGLLGEKVKVDLLDWDVAGKDILYLFTSAPIYFMLALLIDYIRHSPLAGASKRLDPQIADLSVEQQEEDDELVTEEALRVANGGAREDVIRLENLKKMYRTPEGKPKFAVRGLSFGLSRGECFGFLGINGAGKTSTLNMLTGVILPTSGAAYLCGHDVVKEQWKVRRLIGYCPQHDALLDRLTVREHLSLFGRIKGISSANLQIYCEEMMRKLDLDSHVDKLAMTLSGGNKRKLSLAISMMNSPDLIFLDEPSTGVDPAARRLMWDVIEDISTRSVNANQKSCVMLTTHNMEEAEALCSSIGIMVGGRLRCIGTNQQLKSRYGSGYQLEVRLRVPPAGDVGNLVSRYSLASQLSTKDVPMVCSILGDSSRADLIREESEEGHEMFQAFQRHGSVPAKVFAEWWLQESMTAQFKEFLDKTFPGAVILERHDRTLRFRLPVKSPIAQVFRQLEASRKELSVEEYGISQTSLEQLFNEFANQQQEETAPVRGIFRQPSN